MKRKSFGTGCAWGRLRAAVALASLVQGCAAVGPNYEEPVIRTPDAWSQKIEEQVALGPESTLQSWWKVFDDATLNDLIERARQQNLDLQMAVSRVRESRAILAISRGERQPLVDAGASVSGSKLSDDGVLEQVAPDGGFDAHALFELGVDAFWEIDVFGRIRRSIEAAGAGYQASIEDYRDVLVTLFGEVALAYVDVRSAQQRLEIAHANATSQAESLAMAKDQFESGVSSRLDQEQAEANLASTQATIPLIELQMNLALNRLAALLGQDAGSLQSEFTHTEPIPRASEALGLGVPANVIRQRPDIRRAERLLAMQTAMIGVATADLYPRFGLSGFFGLQTRSLGNLLDASSVTWSLGAPVQWNIFSGGRLRGNIRVQEEKAKQLALSYENKVLLAIEEVENSIVSYNLFKEHREGLERAAQATANAVDLVLVQYDTGITDFNNVLVTQRDLFVLQDHLALSDSDVVSSLIRLYKALGGGWDVDGEPPVENGS